MGYPEPDPLTEAVAKGDAEYVQLLLSYFGSATLAYLFVVKLWWQTLWAAGKEISLYMI